MIYCLIFVMTLRLMLRAHLSAGASTDAFKVEVLVILMVVTLQDSSMLGV